jgi:hypothetical protein
MILTIMLQGTHTQKIDLVPLNPNVTLAVNDELKRPLFPKDDTLLDTVTSKEFQDLLLTEPTKKEGQNNIAKYFRITKEWTETKRLGQKKGKFSDSASFCFYLLLTVKYQSSRD